MREVRLVFDFKVDIESDIGSSLSYNSQLGSSIERLRDNFRTTPERLLTSRSSLSSLADRTLNILSSISFLHAARSASRDEYEQCSQTFPFSGCGDAVAEFLSPIFCILMGLVLILLGLGRERVLILALFGEEVEDSGLVLVRLTPTAVSELVCLREISSVVVARANSVLECSSKPPDFDLPLHFSSAFEETTVILEKFSLSNTTR